MVAPVIAAAAIGAAGSAAGGYFGYKANKKAIKAQKQMFREGLAFQREGQRNAEQWLAPAAQSYKPALTRLLDLNGLNGDQAQQNAYGGFREAPGYRYAVDQMEEATNRSAAARGGLLSGRTLSALATQRHGMADQGFNDYYNRINGVYNSGLGAAGQIASGYTGMANNLSNMAMQHGQNMATSALTGGSIINNAIQGGLGSLAYGIGNSSYGKPKITGLYQ